MFRWSLPSVVLFTAALIGGRQLAAQSDSSCHVVVQSGPPRDKIVVGLTDSANSGNAFGPFFERSLFEPLVRRDCTGRYVPALAARWTSISSGLTFTLRRATFSNGTPATAGVLATFLQERGIRASAFDDSTLLAPTSDTADVLSRLSTLAIVTRPDTALIGTLGYSATEQPPFDLVGTRPDARGPQVTFTVRPGADPRDLLDRGVDVLVTDDPATLDYAGRNSAYEVATLPWSRVYLWIGPALAPPDSLPARIGELTAAMRVDARPAQAADWSPSPECRDSTAPRPDRPDRHVLFMTGDRAGQDIASRLVALAGARRILTDGLRTTAVAPPTLLVGMTTRADYGYVFGAPIHELTGCEPFLRSGVTPLVAVRKHVIVRRGVIGIDVDWYGTPRLVLNQ